MTVGYGRPGPPPAAPKIKKKEGKRNKDQCKRERSAGPIAGPSAQNKWGWVPLGLLESEKGGPRFYPSWWPPKT